MTMTATKINVSEKQQKRRSKRNVKRKREARTNMQYFWAIIKYGAVKRHADITQKRGIKLTKRSRIQNEN